MADATVAKLGGNRYSRQAGAPDRTASLEGGTWQMKTPSFLAAGED